MCLVKYGEIDYWEPGGKIKEEYLKPIAYRKNNLFTGAFDFYKNIILEDVICNGNGDMHKVVLVNNVRSTEELIWVLQNKLQKIGHWEFRSTRCLINEFTCRYNRDSLELERLRSFIPRYPEGHKHRPLLDKRIDERLRHQQECLYYIDLLNDYLTASHFEDKSFDKK